MDDADFDSLLAELSRVYDHVDELTRQGVLTDPQKVSVVARLEAIQKLLADPEPRWGVIGILVGAIVAVAGGVVGMNGFLDATDGILDRAGQRPLHEHIQELLDEPFESTSDLPSNLETEDSPEEDTSYTVEGHETSVADKNGDGGTIKTRDGRTINFIRRSAEHHIWDQDPNNLYRWELSLDLGVTYCSDRIRITPY